MFNLMKTKKKFWGIGISLILVMALLFTFFGVPTLRDATPGDGANVVSFGDKVLVVGTEAYAAGTADYTCDGVNDDVQIQAALDALPAGGGQLIILAGNYSFGATVARAIDYVTVCGVGEATYIANDGVTALFNVGVQTGWYFRDVEFDAGGITLTNALEYTLQNVQIGASYWAYDTSHDIGAASFDIPSGRAATLVVAASDADVQSIAQADYWCDGTADDVQIQAAINALPASGGCVQLTEGTFDITTSVDLVDDLTFKGMGASSIIDVSAAGIRIVLDGIDSVKVSDLLIYGNVNTTTLLRIRGGCSNISVKNVTITGGSGANSVGIYVESSSNVVIDNYRYTTGSVNDAIRLVTATDVSITNSTFLAGFYGVRTVDNACDHITISNNSFVSAAGTYNPVAIYDDASHVTIHGNVFTGNGTAHSAIALSCGSYASVTGNIVTDYTTATEAGIEIEYKASHGTATAHDISVVGNVVEGCTWGILTRNVDGGGPEIPYNITIADNSVEGCTIGIYTLDGNLINICGNNLRNNGTNLNTGAGTNLMIRNNVGYVTENSGTATLLNGNTSVVVAHGLSATPTVILITFAENPTNLIADWWVDTVGAANFTFNGVDPGASNLDFYWEAKVR